MIIIMAMQCRNYHHTQAKKKKNEKNPPEARFREIKKHSQDCVASKWGSQDLNLMVWGLYLCCYHLGMFSGLLVSWNTCWLYCFSFPLCPWTCKWWAIQRLYSVMLFSSIILFRIHCSERPPIEGVAVHCKWSSDHRRNEDRSWDHYSVF